MKPRTYFIDIDGTLFKHQGKGLRFQLFPMHEDKQVLEGVAAFLNKLEQAGHHIVLTTARPEIYRELTMRQLDDAFIVYHQLVMGVTSGERVLINDAKSDNAPSARAIVVPRNEGLDQLCHSELSE